MQRCTCAYMCCEKQTFICIVSKWLQVTDWGGTPLNSDLDTFCYYFCIGWTKRWHNYVRFTGAWFCNKIHFRIKRLWAYIFMTKLSYFMSCILKEKNTRSLLYFIWSFSMVLDSMTVPFGNFSFLIKLV